MKIKKKTNSKSRLVLKPKPLPNKYLPVRNTVFISNILKSKKFSNKFKKFIKKFVKTTKKVNIGELYEMQLDFNVKIAEEGLQKDDKDTANSYSVLLIIVQDEIQFRDDNPNN